MSLCTVYGEVFLGGVGQVFAGISLSKKGYMEYPVAQKFTYMEHILFLLLEARPGWICQDIFFSTNQTIWGNQAQISMPIGLTHSDYEWALGAS